MTVAAGKRFPLDGLLNTRDLGGYPVLAAGKQKYIKKGLIFRSGSPENATLADKQFLETLAIKTIIDFRSEEEKTAVFDLSTIKKRAELPIHAGNLMGLVYKSGDWLPAKAAPSEPENEMLRLYAFMPNEAISRYRELFSLLSNPAMLPILIHCSAGKDRTGLACALILYALGADMETIMEDYFYSNENLRPFWGPMEKEKPHLIPYFTVNEMYLNTAFAAIEKQWGMDNYLTKELGADPQHLRELYTEAANP